jgi:riboflavin kinase/FMN adenylyltransferase
MNSEAYVATIGFFDGVHRGHQFLVEQLRKLASNRGLRTMVVTFDRHPRQVLQPGWQPQLLTTLKEKEQLLQLTGIDRLVVLPFTKQTACLSARDFMQQVLSDQLGVRMLLTGYDNRFGHRSEDCNEGFEDYAAWGRELGMEVVCGLPLTAPPSTINHPPSTISSSFIRRLLGEGRIEEATQCLGRPYNLPGKVVHGEQQGHRLGFPTANLCPNALRIVPGGGVYAVRVHTAEGLYGGMTNIGLRPTFDGHRQTIETHLFNYDGDLYGKRLTIDFLTRLRDEQHFDSPEALARQMALDAQAAQNILNSRTPELPNS